MSTAAISRDPRPATTLLAAPARRAQDGWSAPLRVPHGHPFFFDHPLDHVSGIMTIFGLLDLLGAVTGDQLDGTGQRLLAELTFPAMCDLDRPVVLSVTPGRGASGRRLLRSVQGGTPACDGWLELVDGIGPGAPADDQDERFWLCPPELVHRSRVDNVMLGPFPQPGEIVIPMLRPSARHYLNTFARDGYSVRGAIEASRQFLTLLLHRAAGKPLDTKLIWLGFGADLPCAPDTRQGMALRWRAEQLKGSRVDMTFDLVDASSRVIGSFRYQVAAVSPATYERFRSKMVAGSDHP